MSSYIEEIRTHRDSRDVYTQRTDRVRLIPQGHHMWGTEALKGMARARDDRQGPATFSREDAAPGDTLA